jgi:hypothetical protein
MDPNWRKGNPVVIDELTPELGGKLVKAVHEDMVRAKRAKDETARRAREEAAEKARRAKDEAAKPR